MAENQLTKAKEGGLKDTLNKFNIVEYSSKISAKPNDKWDRHSFYLPGEKPSLKHKTIHYRSHFILSIEVEDYFKQNNYSLSKYDGTVWIDEFVWDIDNGDDLNESLSTLRNFLKSLESNYEICLTHIKVNYSSSKGFHIRIPAILFGGFEPSKNLPALTHEIMLGLTDGFKYFDSTIYDRLRPIRILNSVHGSTNRYAIPLTIQEVFKLSTEQIIELS